MDVSFTGEDLSLIHEQSDSFGMSGTVFRPLWHAWFWCGAHLVGPNAPGLWHAGQLALHLTNAFLVALVARTLKLARIPALVAAILFALGAGTSDSLCWIAATNRQLSSLGALTCLLGLLQVERRAAFGAMALGGFLFQFASNEEVYGTGLFATAYLVWVALRQQGARRYYALAAALAPLGLLVVHYSYLRGVAGGYLSTHGALGEALTVQLPRNALARVQALVAGWGVAATGAQVLVGGVVIIAFSWTRGPASRVWIVWGALLASFVPFGLEAGSRYRDYPSQAPLALAVGALVDEVVCALPVGMARTRQAVGMLAVVVACAAGHRERTDAMEAWREATSEIESCRSEIQTRARIPGAQPPVLVNLELSTRMLLLAYGGMDAQHVLEQPTLAFLDTPVALVPPSDLDVVAENAHELFGRRADGTYDAIDHAILAARPRVEPWKLYGLVRRCDTLGEARRMLASGEVDIRREAVMEAPPESIDAVPMCEVAAAERVEIVTPLSFDGARLVGTIALEASCSSPRWLVAQHPFLYSERLRTGPEYALLGQSEDPRVVELRAQTADGATLEVWRAQAFGFALRVPAGVSRVQLQFYIKGASSLGGQTARD